MPLDKGDGNERYAKHCQKWYGNSSISTTDYNLGHVVLMVGHDVLEGIHHVFSYLKST